ncbi:YtxH domain-containing protein [Gryllotalpicola reticulitermitis]|uniref:YtxH domain-containing protein n=1 Tax=Gryllotalpicola reticulitermitis TaxID=1184153 RepID=A0ABV8Q8I6_9MICO
MMKGRLLFAVGLAAGYVLGARAGRKRYDQIAAATNKVWQSEGIQKQVHAAEDYVAEKIGDIPGAVFDGARKAATGAINAVQARTTGKSTNGRVYGTSGAPAAKATQVAAARAAAAEAAAETDSTSEPLNG